MNHQDNHIDDPKIPHHVVLRSGDSFRLPAFYFESLSDRVFHRLEKEMIPDEMNENPFKSPEGYFDTLADRILVKTTKPKVTRIALRTNFRKVWVYSAAAMIIVLVCWFVISWFQQPKNIDFLAESTEDELLEYVSDYSYEFDQQSLANVMNDDELNSIELIDEMDEETSELLIELFE